MSKSPTIVPVRTMNFFEMPVVREALLEEAEDGEKYIEYLKEVYTGDPNNVLILAVVDVDGSIIGFAFLADIPEKTYTWLFNAWADQKRCGKEITTVVFELLKNWTKLRNKNTIRCQSVRGEGLLRAWGFKQYSALLKFDLTESEATDGRRRRCSKHNEHIDEASETNRERASSSDAQRSTERDRSVHGSAGSGSNAGAASTPNADLGNATRRDLKQQPVSNRPSVEPAERPERDEGVDGAFDGKPSLRPEHAAVVGRHEELLREGSAQSLNEHVRNDDQASDQPELRGEGKVV